MIVVICCIFCLSASVNSSRTLFASVAIRHPGKNAGLTDPHAVYPHHTRLTHSEPAPGDSFGDLSGDDLD